MTSTRRTKPEFKFQERVSAESQFADNRWQLARGIAGVQDNAFHINWSFTMPDGSSFSDDRWFRLREPAKQLIWSLHADPPDGRKAVALHTLSVYAHYLRSIIQWMAKCHYERWDELDRQAIKDLFGDLRGRGLSYATARNYHWLISAFYEQRTKLGVAPSDPVPPVTQLGNWPRGVKRLYTPDDIAVPLLAAAIHVIEKLADAVIDMRDQAQLIYDGAACEGLSYHAQAYRTSVYLRSQPALDVVPGRSEKLTKRPIEGLNSRILRVYDACFVVISYLVGCRASETLSLEVDCIEWVKGEDGSSYAYMTGAIRKGAPGTDGLQHRWLVPPIVVRAIDVLEKLSAPWRKISGGKNLWLVQTKPGTALRSSNLPISTMSITAINNRLNNSFTPYIKLPMHKGLPWRITSHQGRRTFARFVGRRDRTALAALSAHLGHVSRGMTDRSYVGTDFQLSELIDDQAMADTRAALEDLLTASRLSGKAGRMLAERSPFRGRVQDGNIDVYISQVLAETDMRLGVCDWGYCLYKRETSACFGTINEPNPALRTQSTCINCANFAVTENHRPIWAQRLSRNLAFLGRSDLDPESRAVAEKRVHECQKLLKNLGAPEE